MQASRNLVGALLELDLERAAGCLTQALARHPGDAMLQFIAGNLHRARGEDAKAAAAYRESIRLEGPAAAASINLAALHQDAGRFDEALRCYDDALRADPGSVLARFNRSLVLLLTEQFGEGLADYELRWQLPELAGRVPEFGRPAWQGGSLRNRTILLYAEQGFGDALQFSRYIAPVSASAARVLVHCAPKLRSLLQRSFPGVSCVAPGEPLPEFDLNAPLVSLPRILGTRPDALPTRHPYLRADPAAVAQRKRELAGRGRQLKVGLCWATDSATGQHRSIPPAALSALAGIENVEFFSLQRGASAGARPALPLVEPAGLNDFDDDAAFVQALDLVITMDTAIAHLAGAVGARVWTVLSFPPDWRWGMGSKGGVGEPTAWYPSMRLYRPQRKGDWDGILAQVGTALSDFARGGGAP